MATTTAIPRGVTQARWESLVYDAARTLQDQRPDIYIGDLYESAIVLVRDGAVSVNDDWHTLVTNPLKPRTPWRVIEGTGCSCPEGVNGQPCAHALAADLYAATRQALDTRDAQSPGPAIPDMTTPAPEPAAPLRLAPSLPPGIEPVAWQEALDTLVTRLRSQHPELVTQRFEDAVAMVSRGDVRLAPEGQHGYVISRSDPSKEWEVNGTCSCPNAAHAPQGRCAHKIAYGLHKRTLQALQTAQAPATQTPLAEPAPPQEETANTPAPTLPPPLRSIRAIIADLSQPLPRRLIAQRVQQGHTIDFIHWQTAVRMLDTYAPGWRGEITRMDQLAGHLVIVYRITIPCLEGEVWREATGCEEEDAKGYGDPIVNAEAQAFKRAAAKFGVALHLYDK